MESKAAIFRRRAIVCEKRAGDCVDLHARHEWNDLAIEWHTLANALDGADDGDIDFA